ncbi:MAG: response regulator, partial [Pirellulales bacterium]|nr:response regulator [Pirellulales bacterium]
LAEVRLLLPLIAAAFQGEQTALTAAGQATAAREAAAHAESLAGALDATRRELQEALYAADHELAQRKQAEQALEEEREWLRVTLTSIGDAVMTTDTEGRVTYLNPVAQTLTGWTQDEAAGQPLERVFTIVNEHSRQPVENPGEKVLRDGLVVGLANNTILIVKDGTERPIDDSAAPIRDQGGVIVGVVLVFRDVTERRRADEASIRRSEQLRRLAQVATRINVAHDVSSVIGIVTEEARSLIGAHQSIASMTTDQNCARAINAVSLSEKYAEWNNDDTKPDGSDIYSLICRTNMPMRMTQAELEAHSAWTGKVSGKLPPIRGWLATPLIGRDGRNIGLVQLSDKYEGEFTEDDEYVLVQLAQIASVAVENARLYEELRNADRRKDEFLATLAHELRNPLAPIRTGLELMRMSGDDLVLIEEVRTTMEGQVQQLVRLVDDLLDVSRITSGKVTLRKERMELASVVQSAVEATRTIIEESRHKLTVTLPPQPVSLEADPTRLAQILSNLLTNAARYTPDGGHIWLTAERQGSDVVVTVKDTGIGIPADMLGRIFEMFAQVDRSLERSQGGLGIGLTLVKRLVEMHGGSVQARSHGPEQGSEFTVRLPIVTELVQAQPARDESLSVSGKLRVLAVDDNKDAAKVLGMMLKALGNEVRTANDGLEALDVAAEFRPDIVLMDIGMPRLNGYDTARRMREQLWGKRMVLVALTGWGQEEDRQRTKDAGFDHHFVKPIEPAALRTLLADRQSTK